MNDAVAAATRPSSIICIGGANVDKKLYIKDEMVVKTSNPVTSSRTVGGVARNIAENLGRLGEKVVFLSARGNDPDWLDIYQASSPYMDLSYVTKFAQSSTGSYTAVLDKNGDLSIALADMDIFDQITPELLLRNAELLIQARCMVVDLNCPSETIEFLCDFASEHQIPLIVIPVSSPKMDRLPKRPQSLSAVSWLIVNKDETENYMNMSINDQRDWEEAVTKWLELGIKNVVVTNGSKGVMAGVNTGEIHYYPAIETPGVVDVTGAGDSFCSGVIYSWLQNRELDFIIQSGLVNAHKTIMSRHTVRQELSPQQFILDMEEL